MEEKVLVQSMQYNIKKTAKKISCIIFALSIIASAFMLISYYTENLRKILRSGKKVHKKGLFLSSFVNLTIVTASDRISLVTIRNKN